MDIKRGGGVRGTGRLGYSGRADLRRKRKNRIDVRRLVIAIVIALAVVGLVIAAVFIFKAPTSPGRQTAQTTPTGQASGEVSPASTPTPEPTLGMNVAAVNGTRPSDFDITTNVYEGTTKVDSYTRPEPIMFGEGKDYTDLEGIITFRGNSYREGANYGTADVTMAELEQVWSAKSGSVKKSGGVGYWTGSGWTGQPLIVKWPEKTKQLMNLYDEKKADPDLVEVIYACLDGNIYFLDLKDGTPTRPAIKTGGGPIKGTCSLYPNGIPMLFVGQGDALPKSEPDGEVKYRIYNLFDQSLMYTLPDGDKDPNSYREWHAYDSSALIDVETDTLIEPGENGILYTIKLNTQYNGETGTLAIDPDEPVKFTYTAPDYDNSADNNPDGRWWGFEDSAVIWQHYIYLSENGGKMMCIDLNTMQLVWVQDIWDDSNSTPLFEESMEDGTAYIYTSTSLHITADKNSEGPIPIWKINAATGEIVWQSQSYECHTVSGTSGGVEATGLLGKNDISDLVIYPVARTPDKGTGVLVALSKETGKEVWRFDMQAYAWSSPVAVYTPEGKSYIVQCDTDGNIFLLEGTTGKLLNTLVTSEEGAAIEASPAVYNDMIVIGTRGQQIFGIKIK
jgi:outer membrane protein assembly factor BamB